MAEQFQNSLTDPTSTVDTAVNASVTSLIVAAGHGARFPSSGDFRIRVGDELMKVTSRSTDTLTVVRGDGGSTAASHGVGDAVNLVQTAESFTALARRDAANTFLAGAQDFGAAASLIVPKAAGAAPTADGDLRYDTTQDMWVGGGAGGVVGRFPRTLYATYPDETLSAATIGTTETAYADSYTIPANYLIAGRILRLTTTWILVSSATSPSITNRMKIGGTTVYTGAVTVAPSNQTAMAVSAVFLIQGTAAPGASVNVETSWVGMTNITNPPYARGTTAQPIALATNGSLAVTFTLQYSAGTAGNTLRWAQFLVEEVA